MLYESRILPRVDTIRKRLFFCSVEARFLLVKKKFRRSWTGTLSMVYNSETHASPRSDSRVTPPFFRRPVLPTASHLSLGADEDDDVDVEVPAGRRSVVA